jgi:hypothetical protein
LPLCINCGKEFEISRLKRLLGNQTVCPSCKAEKEEKIQRYVEAVKHFGKDDYLSHDEENALQELKCNLALTDDDLKLVSKDLEKLRRSTVQTNVAACEQKVAAISSDGRITPQEEIELAEMMKSLGITETDLPNKTLQTLNDVRMLTELSKGTLPVLKTNILLKQNEVCHFATPAQLLEELTRTHYVGGSSGVGFRVAKGVTFRTGSFRGSPIKESFPKITDSGTLYVTNKKVLFVGTKKNVSYPIKKIVDITKYTDGIKFQKENESKPRIFLISRPTYIDAVGMIVSMLAQS